MKFPFFWLSLGFATGIVVQKILHLPLLWVGSVFFCTIPWLWVSRTKMMFIPFLILMTASLGAVAFDQCSQRPVDAVEYWAENSGMSHYAHLEGIVMSEPETKSRGRKKTVSLIMESKNLLRYRNQQSELLDVKGAVQVFLFQPPFTPAVGDWIRISGRLEKPGSILNPGQFNYREYLASNQIHAIFTGFGGRSLRLIKQNQWTFYDGVIARIRSCLSKRIDRFFQGDHAAIIKALILGIRKSISPDLRDDFVVTGTVHVLAISGMNISLVAGTFYFFLIALRISQKQAAIGGILVVLFYVLVSGAGVPVQRAGWMSAAIFLGILMEREHHFWNSFCLSFFIMLVVDPRNLVNISFQLSFLCIFSLIYLLPQAFEQWRWKDSLGRSVAVLIGTSPVILYYFNVFSPLSLIANLGAIPLFHLSIISAAFALLTGALPWVGGMNIYLADWVMGLAISWIHILAKLKWGYVFLPTPSIFQLILYYLVLAIYWGIRRHPVFVKMIWLRFTMLTFWFAIVASFFWPGNTPEFTLTVFSAGRNELAHIQFGKRLHWLVNAGRGFPSDQSRWMIRPFLKYRGINRLTGIVVTDFYLKHIGGLPDLMRYYKDLDYLIYPKTNVLGKTQQFAGFGRRKTNRIEIDSELSIRIKDKGEIRCLGEAKGQLVLLVTYAGRQFLFLPNLSDEAIDLLRCYQRLIYQVDVLILPSGRYINSVHEGAVWETIFDVMDPDIVVSPAADEPLHKFLQDRDIKMFDLSSTGALIFSVNQAETFSANASSSGHDFLQIDSMIHGRELVLS